MLEELLQRYPYLLHLTAEKILSDKVNVYDEEFGIPFVYMLEKFAEGCDITDQHKAKAARHLLKLVNEEE